jgi:membrane-associated protein
VIAVPDISPQHVGYGLLVLLVGGESMGILLPGESALIAAAALAHRAGLQISLVIALAALAAIAGDNIGYALGRSGARSLLLMAGPFGSQRADLLARGERLFARHGGKAVFLGRWTAVLRTTAAWLAGASRMPWPAFMLWNAAGAISWATSIGLTAYALGAAATATVTTTLFVTLIVAGVLAVASAHRRRRGGPDRLPGGGPCGRRPASFPGGSAAE